MFALSASLRLVSRALPRLPWSINRLFLAAVVVPTGLASLYFGGIASGVYVSESRFVLRTVQRPAANPLGSLLQGSGLGGLARTTDDAFAVCDYLVSRDAMAVADRAIGLRSAFGHPDIDVLSRFAGIDGDTSTEALHRFYQRRVEVRLDAASSIVTLTARAFGSEQVRALNEELLQSAERFVNRLNERARTDGMKAAQAEAVQAERRVVAAAMAVAAYRHANRVMDPEKQSALRLQQIARLRDDLFTTRAQIEQFKALAPQNPQLQSLQNRAATLQREIGTESDAVTGGHASLAAKTQEFQRLELEREFADRQYLAAMASLEQVRAEAQRQQVYLERIVQPSLPDVAVEPRRLRAILSVLGLGVLAWGVLSLLLAGVREHQA